jgi:hypothetical protein
LLATATACLLAAVGLGFEHGDVVTTTTEASAAPDHIARAATIAFLLYMVMAIAAAFMFFKSGAMPGRLHWLLRFAGALAVVIVGSWAGVVVMLRVGGGPDPIEAVADRLYRSLPQIVPWALPARRASPCASISALID